MALLPIPEVPSTQSLRLLVPKSVPYMAFGTRVLEHLVRGPSGHVIDGRAHVCAFLLAHRSGTAEEQQPTARRNLMKL